jgi:signal transduction histidine kinase
MPSPRELLRPRAAAPPPGGARGRLATRHALVWATLLSLLLAISGGIGAWFAWRDTVAGVGALQRAQAEALAARIERDVAAIAQPLRWIVDDPALAHGDASEALQIELLRAMRRLGAIDELRWVDPAGRERLALSRIAPDVVDSGRDRSGDARVAAARRDGEFFDRVRFADDGEPHVMIVLAAPRGGPVLIAEIGLRPVLAATALQLAPEGLAYVVDAEGRLLSHPDVGLVLRQTSMSSLPHVRRALAAAQPMSMRDERDVAGRTVFAAAAPIPRLGWTVFVEQDRDQALAPVWRVLGQSALLVAFGVLVAVVASAWLARRLTQPIRELQAGAQAIGRGRFDQRLEVRTGDELQALAEAFERMASDLQSSYATLEARVAERTRELADANEAKGRFLAAASHDLRQPVHALGLFAGQLRAAADADRRRELIGHIEASVAAFEALLASLLDLSRLDAGVVPVHREAVDLAALIARVGAGVQAEAQRKGLRLRATPRRVWVDSDPVLLERIVLNLAGNAVRYTERGCVRLAVVRHGDQAALIVADTGTGIAPEHLPHVFREFYRAGDRPSGEAPGLGLGLAIVERLAHLLGHRVRVRSRPGRGTCFALTLPWVHPPDARTEAPPVAAVQTGLEGCLVLVVDDDAAVREAMRGQLGQWGCQVRLAASAAEALHAFAASPPHLAIVDLRLGGDDGLALARRLRELGDGQVAVAIVTGETAAQPLQAARDAGFTVLAKPARPARLRAVVEASYRPDVAA